VLLVFLGDQGQRSGTGEGQAGALVSGAVPESFFFSRGLGVGRAGVWRGLAVLEGEPPIRALILTGRGDLATARGAVEVVPGALFAGYCAVSGRMKIVRCFAPG